LKRCQWTPILYTSDDYGDATKEIIDRGMFDLDLDLVTIDTVAKLVNKS